jgi:hypothetical protein
MAGGGQRRPRRAARAVPWGGEAAAGDAAAAAGSFAAQASDRATGHMPHHASSRRWGRGARPRRTRAGRRSAVTRRLSFARQLPPLGAVAGVDGQNGEGRRQRRGVGLGEKGRRRVGGREAWAGERPSSNPASRPPASQRGDAPRRRSPARGVRSRFPPFCATSSGGGRARGQPGASGRSRSVARGWVGIGRGRRAVEAVSERARRRPSALGARPRSRAGEAGGCGRGREARRRRRWRRRRRLLLHLALLGRAARPQKVDRRRRQPRGHLPHRIRHLERCHGGQHGVR